MMAWFAIMTKPRAEELADLSLRLLGVRTYFPHWIERVSKRSKLEWKQSVFQNYIFVEDPGRFDVVTDADGVLYVLPFAIPAAVMDRILKLSPDGFISDKMREKIDPRYRRRPKAGWRKGMNVRFNEGSAFFGFLGQIDAILGNTARVMVLSAAIKKPVVVPLNKLNAA